MDNKNEKPTARADAPLAAYQEKHSKRANYKPCGEHGQPRTVDGNVAIIKSARRLVSRLGGQWWEAGVAQCPCCNTPGMAVSQDSHGIISVDCPEKCDPSDIHAALLKRGIGVADMWVS